MTREHNGERWWRENRACFECEGRSIGQWPCDTCDGTGIDPSARGDTSSTADGHADAPERRKCVFCNGSRIVTHSSHGDHYGTRVLPCPSCTDGMLPAGTKVVHPETPRNAELFAKLDALREATFGPEIERCVCGGQPHTVYGGRESWYVDCTDCAWSGDYADTEAGAIDAWNSVMRAARERDELRTILATAQEDARLSHEYAQRVRDEHAETIRELRIELEAVKADRDLALQQVDLEHEKLVEVVHERDGFVDELAAERTAYAKLDRDLSAKLGSAMAQRDIARAKRDRFERELRKVAAELAAERARPRPKVTLREAEGAAVQWYLEES